MICSLESIATFTNISPGYARAWLAVAPKAAGFIAIIRLYVEGVGAAALVWMPVVAAVAGMTIITGNLMAIPQHNIKRLLAYSGIAHIGYMLVGLAALTANGIAMVLFYLIAYLFGNMGAFMVVEAVARSEQSDNIDAYKGLAQRSPLLALAMLVFLLSLGGIPFVAGFWAKLFIFKAAIDQHMYALAIVGAVLTIVSIGLLGMRERAQLIGAKLSISGRPGKGTAVVVTVPASVARGRE